MEQVFESREQLLTSIQQHAISHDYAITIIRSNKEKNIFLGCNREDVYRDRINAPDGAKRRKTGTRC